MTATKTLLSFNLPELSVGANMRGTTKIFQWEGEGLTVGLDMICFILKSAL